MIEIRANAIRVRSVVVVHIAVVVDISEVRRRNNVPQPPVHALQKLPRSFPGLHKFVVCTPYALI